MSRNDGKPAMWRRRWVQVLAAAALLFSAGVAVGASAHSGGGECRPAVERVQR